MLGPMYCRIPIIDSGTRIAAAANNASGVTVTAPPATNNVHVSVGKDSPDEPCVDASR